MADMNNTKNYLLNIAGLDKALQQFQQLNKASGTLASILKAFRTHKSPFTNIFAQSDLRIRAINMALQQSAGRIERLRKQISTLKMPSVQFTQTKKSLQSNLDGMEKSLRAKVTQMTPHLTKLEKAWASSTRKVAEAQRAQQRLPALRTQMNIASLELGRFKQLKTTKEALSRQANIAHLEAEKVKYQSLLDRMIKAGGKGDPEKREVAKIARTLSAAKNVALLKGDADVLQKLKSLESKKDLAKQRYGSAKASVASIPNLEADQKNASKQLQDFKTKYSNFVKALSEIDRVRSGRFSPFTALQKIAPRAGESLLHLKNRMDALQAISRGRRPIVESLSDRLRAERERLSGLKEDREHGADVRKRIEDRAARAAASHAALRAAALKAPGKILTSLAAVSKGYFVGPRAAVDLPKAQLALTEGRKARKELTAILEGRDSRFAGRAANDPELMNKVKQLRQIIEEGKKANAVINDLKKGGDLTKTRMPFQNLNTRIPAFFQKVASHSKLATSAIRMMHKALAALPYVGAAAATAGTALVSVFFALQKTGLNQYLGNVLGRAFQSLTGMVKTGLSVFAGYQLLFGKLGQSIREFVVGATQQFGSLITWMGRVHEEFLGFAGMLESRFGTGASPHFFKAIIEQASNIGLDIEKAMDNFIVMTNNPAIRKMLYSNKNGGVVNRELLDKAMSVFQIIQMTQPDIAARFGIMFPNILGGDPRSFGYGFETSPEDAARQIENIHTLRTETTKATIAALEAERAQTTNADKLAQIDKKLAKANQYSESLVEQGKKLAKASDFYSGNPIQVLDFVAQLTGTYLSREQQRELAGRIGIQAGVAKSQFKMLTYKMIGRGADTLGGPEMSMGAYAKIANYFKRFVVEPLISKAGYGDFDVIREKLEKAADGFLDIVTKHILPIFQGIDFTKDLKTNIRTFVINLSNSIAGLIAEARDLIFSGLDTVKYVFPELTNAIEYLKRTVNYAANAFIGLIVSGSNFKRALESIVDWVGDRMGIGSGFLGGNEKAVLQANTLASFGYASPHMTEEQRKIIGNKIRNGQALTDEELSVMQQHIGEIERQSAGWDKNTDTSGFDDKEKAYYNFIHAKTPAEARAYWDAFMSQNRMTEKTLEEWDKLRSSPALANAKSHRTLPALWGPGITVPAGFSLDTQAPASFAVRAAHNAVSPINAPVTAQGLGFPQIDRSVSFGTVFSAFQQNAGFDEETKRKLDEKLSNLLINAGYVPNSFKQTGFNLNAKTGVSEDQFEMIRRVMNEERKDIRNKMNYLHRTATERGAFPIGAAGTYQQPWGREVEEKTLTWIKGLKEENREAALEELRELRAIVAAEKEKGKVITDNAKIIKFLEDRGLDKSVTMMGIERLLADIETAFIKHRNEIYNSDFETKTKQGQHSLRRYGNEIPMFGPESLPRLAASMVGGYGKSLYMGGTNAIISKNAVSVQFGDIRVVLVEGRPTKRLYKSRPRVVPRGRGMGAKAANSRVSDMEYYDRWMQNVSYGRQLNMSGTGSTVEPYLNTIRQNSIVGMAQ